MAISTLFTLSVLFTLFSFVSCQTTRYYSTVVAGGFIQQGTVPANESIVFYTAGLCVTSQNEVFFAEMYSNRIRKLNKDNLVETVAGIGVTGFDGYGPLIANETRFKSPFDVKINETSGEIFIADTFNFSIRKMLKNGTIITIAGDGGTNYLLDNVQARNASIGWPVSIALAPNGEVYFSEVLNSTVRKIRTDGTIVNVAGTGVSGYNGDGILATSAQLNTPQSIALNSQGELIILDSANSRIRKVLNNGTIISLNVSSPISSSLYSLAIHPLTNDIYFTDDSRVKKLVNESTVLTVAGTNTDGYNGDNRKATTALLFFPRGIAFNKNGDLYISDQHSNRIRKVDADGIITTIAGTGSIGYVENGNATSIALNTPYSYVSESGDILVGEYGSYYVRNISKGIVKTIAGTGVPGNAIPVLAINAPLNLPRQVSQRYNGDMLIAENSRLGYVNISTGAITFIRSIGGVNLNSPRSTFWTGVDEFLIAESGRNRILVVIASTLSVKSRIGSGAPGYLDSTSLTGAKFFGPCMAVANSNGEIFVADSRNNLIRKVFTNGTVTTIAGVYGCTTYNGDGIFATSACINDPQGVAVNSIGEVFITDGLNNRIRKVRTDGIIVTIAGTGIGEFNKWSGDSLEVSVYQCRTVNVLSNGEVYFADLTNNYIRKLTPYCLQSYQYFNITQQRCTCKKDGYFGEYCEVYNCYNYSSNSTLVCGGHGICVSPNNCSCESGFYGNSCESFDCDGIGCLHNGTCSGTSKCKCPTGYGGSRCEYILCYSKTEAEPTVCGGHGTCVAYNNCSCSPLWYGQDCSVTTCYSIPSNQTNSCGLNGTCVAPDQCSCDSGYGGSQCQYLVCNNKLETDSNVCSGQGTCTSPDYCKCKYGYVGNNCQYIQVYLDIPTAMIYLYDGPLLNITTELFSCSDFIVSTQLADLGESDLLKCYWKNNLFKIYLGYGHSIGDGSIIYFNSDIMLKVNANSTISDVKSRTLTSSVNEVLSTLPSTQDIIIMSNADEYFHNFKEVKRVWSCTKCSSSISNRLALFVNRTMIHIPVSMMNELSLDQSYLKSASIVLDSTSSLGMTSTDSEKSARVQPSTKSLPPSMTWQGNNVKKSAFSCVGHNCIVEVALNSLNTSISYTFSGFFSLLNSEFANKQMFRLVNVYGGALVDSEYSSNAQIFCFHLKTYVTLSLGYDFVYTTFDRLDFALSNVNRTYPLNDISAIEITPQIDDPFVTTFTISDYLSYEYTCYQIYSSTNWQKLSGNLCSSLTHNEKKLTLNPKNLPWVQGTYLIMLNITVTQTYSTRYYTYAGWIELVNGENLPIVSYDLPPAISPSHQPLTLSAIVNSASGLSSLTWRLLSGNLINLDGNERTNTVTDSLVGNSKKSTLQIDKKYLMEGESYTFELSAANQQGKTNVTFTTKIDQTPRFSCSYWNLRNEINVAHEGLLAISCINLPNEPISAFQVEFYTLSGSRINLVSNTFKKNIITKIPFYSTEESVNLIVKFINRYGSMSNITRSVSVQLPSIILNGHNTFTSRYSYVIDQFYTLKRSEPLRIDTCSSIHSLLSILIQNSTSSQFASDASANLPSLQALNDMFREMINLLGNIEGITYKVEEKLVQMIVPTVSTLLKILHLTDSSTYVSTQIETWLKWIYSGMTSASQYYSSQIISQILDNQHFEQIEILHNILEKRYADTLSKQQTLKDLTAKFILLAGYSPNNSTTMMNVELSEQLNGKTVKVLDRFGTVISLPNDLSTQLTSTENIKLFYSSTAVTSDQTQGNILKSRPLVDVSLYGSSGSSLSVNNLKSPISIRFGEIETSDKENLNVSCVYYDSSSGMWSQSGIQSTYSVKRRENGYLYFSLECNTTHLSLFSAQETSITPVVSSSKARSDDTLTIILATVIPVGLIFVLAFVVVIVILSCVIWKLKKNNSKDLINLRNVELDFRSNDFPTESIFFQPLTSVSSNGTSSSESFNPLSRYSNLERIGQGAFGSVFKCDDAKTSNKKAIKVMKFTSMEELNNIMKEGSQLMNVSHPNILKVNDFFVSKDQLLCIDMDFYELGDLMKLTQKTVECSETLIRQLTKQMCEALNYIHNSMNIIHRDIKPSNIFIKSLENNSIHAIVADFGLARSNSGSIQNSYAGTPIYMSPELGFGASYSHNTDIYSLGVTLYQIMSKDMQTSISQLYVMKDQKEVKKILKETLEKSPVKYSPELIDIIISMVDKDPLSRPQARDILNKLGILHLDQ